MTVKRHGVNFDITAQDNATRAFLAVEHALNGVNKAADRVGRVLQGAFVATTLISAGKAFTDAATKAEQSSKRLDATLKATGGVAGMTREQLEDLAETLARSTQFDTTGLRSASADLAKFGNIHGETFRRALGLSADLAAFMGTDLNAAVQAVGKALTSPKDGLGALEKQVGKFNPAAEAMIKTLVETGNQAKAQALVLDLLKGKIGGAAEALNTGLFKSTNEMKKAWDDLLESIGKTQGVQAGAKSSLGFLEQSFKDLKSIIENGDWVEKALALMAFAGGWRGMKLTPPPEPGVRVRKGAIRGAPGAMSLDQELAGAPMSEADQKSWKAMIEEQERRRKEAADKARAEREKQTREDERIAKLHVDAEEEAARTTAEAWDHWGKIQLDEEKKRTEARELMWKQVFESIDREQEEAIEQGRVLLDSLEADARKAEEAAKDLGYAFTSAFEDAVIEGKNLWDVVKGLGKDLAKIILREGVTKPFGSAITQGVQGIDWWGGIKEFFGFGGGRAGGGPVEAGRMYEVAEQGPEMLKSGGRNYLLMGSQGGRVSPAAGGGGGGTTINIYPDLRGASVEAVDRLHRMVRNLAGNVPSIALSAVANANRRGRRW